MKTFIAMIEEDDDMADEHYEYCIMCGEDVGALVIFGPLVTRDTPLGPVDGQVCSSECYDAWADERRAEVEGA